MGYMLARTGIPEDDEWEGTEPEGILRSWWGAFMFEYKPL